MCRSYYVLCLLHLCQVAGSAVTRPECHSRTLFALQRKEKIKAGREVVIVMLFLYQSYQNRHFTKELLGASYSGTKFLSLQLTFRLFDQNY